MPVAASVMVCMPLPVQVAVGAAGWVIIEGAVFTVTVAVAPVKPVVLIHPLASVIDVNVYGVVELGDGPLKGVPLTTLL